MTDKELKKMSRLELLELLLEESKENEILNSRVEKLQHEKQETENIQMLQHITGQLEDSLRQFQFIAEEFKKNAHEGITVKSRDERVVASPVVTVQYRSDEDKTAKEGCESCTDIKLFRRLMLFFSQRPDVTSMLPMQLQSEVVGRIRQAINENET